MRSLVAATFMMTAAALSAQAQTPPPGPKPAPTAPVRPELQTPADTATALAQAERTAIQSDLAWAGRYNGAITGEVSARMVAAIKAFQKDQGGKSTGVLNPQERSALGDAAKKMQSNVGWKIVTDMVTGARLGIPARLTPQQASDANGSRWSSSTGTIQIALSRRKEAQPTIAKLADQEKREPAGRRIDYSAIKPDFFVLSGMQGLKKFYVRGQFKGDEVRILTILHDQATDGTMAPVVIAMSSAFNPFPVGAQAAGPPPRKSVEYATGVVVSSDGAVVTDRAAVEGCLSIVIAGHGNADRIAEDKAHDLALLRLYGARGLVPLGLSGNATSLDVDLVGIADPQNQGGATAVSVIKAQITPPSGGGDPILTTAPGLGFSGAAAIDGGHFAGIALLKPAVVAGPSTAAPAALVPADAVRVFLKNNGVTPATGSSDAKVSVLRVICVRK